MPFNPDQYLAKKGGFNPDAYLGGSATPKSSTPEQGNMFTQSAEDIQYDPVSGVPLNTSSYGSAPTGGTEYFRKALTTAAALPINVATGVAKNVGGLAQTFNRYLGGESSKGNLSIPEEGLNALNQIEAGTQQQSGSPNLLKGASMVGQAAPWFATGGAIGAIPSYVNAAKNIGTGVAMGGASALATPEEVGMTPEQFREAKNKNIAIQGAIGGAFPAAGEIGSRIASLLRGTKQTPQMTTAIENARDIGYTMPPTQAGGGIVSRALEGLAGKASTAQAASIKNQEITNKLATKSLGLPEDTVLSPEVIKNVRDVAGKAYDKISNTGEIITTDAYSKALDKIIEPFMQTAKAFPDAEISPVVKQIAGLRSKSFDAGAAVEKIKQLRTAADDAYRTGSTEIGKANKDAAKALEDAVEKHLEAIYSPGLLKEFKDARQLIAKTYTVENAMNKTTGTVDAKKLADRLQRGKPMSEELKQIAQFGQAFPKAIQTPERIGGSIGISPLDYTVAGVTGGASLLGGEDKATSGALGLATLLARPGARRIALSNPVQNRLAQQATSPSAVRQALPSPQEARQLAKMLLMQRLGGTTENR
jgi:hypothetical protein